MITEWHAKNFLVNLLSASKFLKEWMDFYKKKLGKDLEAQLDVGFVLLWFYASFIFLLHDQFALL